MTETGHEGGDLQGGIALAILFGWPYVLFAGIYLYLGILWIYERWFEGKVR